MRYWLAFVLSGLIAAPPVLAQPAPAPGPAVSVQQVPPSRVGAVTFVAGDLAFHASGETRWSAAGINYPFASGDSFWTDPQARAQIQIGPTTLSMDGGTEIDVTDLNEEAAQLSLPQGRIYLHLRQLDPGQSFEVDLPQGAVWLLARGSYDIDAGNPHRGTRLAVFGGSARFDGSGVARFIHSGEVIGLSQTNPATVTNERAAGDDFVQWCNAHDYREDRVVTTTHYISPHMTGYAGLTSYGAWHSNPQYSEVWYPSQVPADWAPYREGRWIWVEPWGWTWVDQEPWGFAPFHYGRWAYIDDRWGWVPGEYVAQPVYAPALVAFVSLGAAEIGTAVAAGPAVGWFPLAPGEVYWPSYTRNTTYIRNLNVTNVKNINTMIGEARGGAPPPQAVGANFVNRRFTTVVPQRVFASADPVAPAVVHVPQAALQKAPVVSHPPQVTPVVAKASVNGAPPPPTGSAPRGPTRGGATAPMVPSQPPHPGAPVTAHPGAPSTAPASTAALPPRPGGTPTAHPGAARPANTAALPPPSGVAAPHRLPPPSAHAIPSAAPNAGRPEHIPRTESARRELPSAVQPERRLPPAAVIHPAPAPHPAAPAFHSPAEAQIVHPPVVHPSPPVNRPAAAAIVAPRPEPLPAHAPAAPPHPTIPAPHPVQPAAQVHPAPVAPLHPHPAPSGKAAPKEKEKQEGQH
jgi:hypothetical protein